MPSGGSYSGKYVSNGMYNAIAHGFGMDTVTYTYTDANNCTDSIKGEIRVNAVTETKMTYLENTCDNSPILDLSAVGSPSGGSYSGTAVTANTFDPSVAGAGNYDITYTLTNRFNCTDSSKRIITVEASPQVTIGGDTLGCAPDNPPILFATPSGLEYKWNNGERSDTLVAKFSGTAWVKVTDPSTWKRCSNSDSISVQYDSVCVGLNEIGPNTKVSFYPNPSNGVFSYSLQRFDGKSVKLIIYSLQGEMVFEKTITNVNSSLGTIDLSDKENGVYLIYVKTDEQTITTRFTLSK
jgi:hypothetical protein